jgi:hypothetical protein
VRGLALIEARKKNGNAMREAQAAKQQTTKVVALTKKSFDQIKKPKAVVRGGRK